jgi:CheY-like chemotaxis protein
MAELLPARVLLVEDSPVNQKVALRMLERLGYRGDGACDGAGAVEVVQRSTYDVVLMDIQPVLDGLEATRQIRRAALPGPQPWIVAITAAISGDEARCRAAGMDDYVTKPVQLQGLAAAMRRGVLARGPTVRERAPAGDIGELQAALAGLAAELGADFVARLLDEFLARALRHRGELKDALLRHDRRALKRLAHTLQGEAGSIGARALARACAALQEAASGDGSGWDLRTAEVLEALTTVETVLRTTPIAAAAPPDA